MIDPKRAAAAKAAAENLVGTLLRELRKDPRPIEDKILAAYQILKREGYKLDVTYDPKAPTHDSMTESLLRKHLDCDTTSAIIVCLANAAGWKGVQVVAYSDHVAIRFAGKNFDYGKIEPDSYYLQNWGGKPPGERALDGSIGIRSISSGQVGVILSASKKHREAVAHFTDALTLNPNDPSALTNRGDSLTQLGMYGPAISDLNKAIAIDPNFADSYVRRSRARIESKDVAAAMPDLNRAIALDPKNGSAFHDRAVISYNQGNYTQAIKDYTQALNIDGPNAELFLYRSSAFHRSGKIDDALSDLDRSIGLNPGNKRARHNRGAILMDRGFLDRALSDFNEAIRLDSKYALAYENRSKCLASLGRHAEAAADARMAKSLQ